MRYLYRMTHIENIPHILRHGITHRLSPNANPEYRSIGSPAIIGKRDAQIKAIEGGGSISLGDFIPFHFYARMPMLYNIQKGFNVTRINPSDIVYLILDLKSVTALPEITCYFSDRHAINKYARFYGIEHFEHMDSLLDLDAIRNNSWGEDYSIREKKQAEFLVKGDIPTSAIFQIHCYDEAAKRRLLAMGVNVEVKVSPQAYF